MSKVVVIKAHDVSKEPRWKDGKWINEGPTVKHKVTRKGPGLYQVSFPDHKLVFDVHLTEPMGDGSQRWYFKNANNDYEGGDDHFYTKRECLSALLGYIPRRKWNREYGWHVGPE